jgi:hypothetical protein
MINYLFSQLINLKINIKYFSQLERDNKHINIKFYHTFVVLNLRY